jgi:hypothetical protein
MAWSASGIFASFVAGQLGGDNIFDLDQSAGNTTDVYKVALYNNTTTPSVTVSRANTAYNADQWVTANEVSQAGQWPAGGVQIGATAGQVSGVAANMTVTLPGSTNIIMLDATDTASNTAATLANVYGTLLYNDTKTGTAGAGSGNVGTGTTPVADTGVCFNYLGGTNSVTGGTLTIVWSANGLFRISV